MLGEQLGMLDTERAARTGGSRFVYLLGDIVQVQFALVRRALDVLTPRGFVPVIPPVLVREEAMFGSGFLPTDEVNIYVTDPDELSWSARRSLAGRVPRDRDPGRQDLPVRYAGYWTSSVARPARTGRTWADVRVHQFDKVEMFSFARPEDSWDEHELMVGIEEEIIANLDLPYRVVNVAAGDLGGAAAKKYDLEVSLRGRAATGSSRPARTTPTTGPGAGRHGFVETSGEVEVLHTLDGTATAVSRALIAILENYQRADGTVRLRRPCTPTCREPPRAAARGRPAAAPT